MSQKSRIPSLRGTRLSAIFSEQEFRSLAVQLVAEFDWASADQIRDACCAAASSAAQFSPRQAFLKHAQEYLTASRKQADSVEAASH